MVSNERVPEPAAEGLLWLQDGRGQRRIAGRATTGTYLVRPAENARADNVGLWEPPVANVFGGARDGVHVPQSVVEGAALLDILEPEGWFHG